MFKNRIKELRMMKASEIADHPQNWRRHPAAQQKALRNAMERIGFADAVLAYETPEGLRLVDGHLRKSISGDQEIPVLITDLNEQEARAVLASLDPLAMMAETDEDMLRKLLDGMDDFGGLDDLLDAVRDQAGIENESEPQEAPEAQINRAEELLQKWNVQRGDLWIIGEHRLLCGDSTSADDVARVMGGERADMVFTDPPYNIASENDVIASNVSRSMNDLKNADWDKDFDLQPFLDAMLDVMDQDVSVYVCTSHHLAQVIWAWMGKWATHYNWCVWNKPNPMPSLMKRHWTWNAELICYATRGKHTFNFPDVGHAPSVWTFTKHKDTTHPTEKPADVPLHAIKHSSNPNMIIYDGFGGSGTTMVACQQLQRKCRMIEIEPKYCAVILERMSQMGLNPELNED